MRSNYDFNLTLVGCCLIVYGSRGSDQQKKVISIVFVSEKKLKKKKEKRKKRGFQPHGFLKYFRLCFGIIPLFA